LGFRSLEFEVTSRCNLDCRYCGAVWKGPGGSPPTELDTESALTILRWILAGADVPAVTLTGGEPLLRDDLETIAGFLSLAGVRVTVATNGTLLTKERAESLVAAGVDAFELPILADVPSVHRSLTRGGSLAAVLEAIGRIRYLGARAIAVFLAAAPNLPRIEGALEVAAGAGANEVRIDRFVPVGEGARNLRELLPTPASLARGLSAANRAAAAGLPVRSGVPIPPCVLDTSRYSEIRFETCPIPAGGGHVVVDPAGAVRPCRHSPATVGRLAAADLPALLESEAAKAWRRDRPPGCGSCPETDACGGGCRASAVGCYGRADLPDPLVLNHRAATGSQPARGARA
jgi:pyrroloquinoline quinone biosynthesis protein E